MSGTALCSKDDLLALSQAELDTLLEQVWCITLELRRARAASTRPDYVKALSVAQALVEELVELCEERRDFDAGYGIGPGDDDLDFEDEPEQPLPDEEDGLEPEFPIDDSTIRAMGLIAD